MRKICPACITRLDHVVHPECVICNGAGHVTLGEGAMELYTPEVVSRAVELGLEAAARVADMNGTLSDDRATRIKSAVDTMRVAGLLAQQDEPQATDRPAWPVRRGREQHRNDKGMFALKHDPALLAQDSLQQPIIPLDEVLSAAGPYQYQEYERPGARGLPGLSDNGYPSHLARVCDPMDPGRDTRAWVRERHFDGKRAEVLVEAGQEAARMKRERSEQPEQLDLWSSVR